MNSSDSPTGWFDNTGRAVTRMPGSLGIATNGIVFNEQREVLLQKRADNGFWGLPGGFVEIGESVEHGAIREVREETNLQVTVRRMVGVYSDPEVYSIASYSEDTLVHIVTLVFECQYQSGDLAISDESTDIGYFNPEALPENTVLSHRIRIADALANKVEPFIR